MDRGNSFGKCYKVKIFLRTFYSYMPEDQGVLRRVEKSRGHF